MSTIYTDDYIKQTYVNRNLPAINGAHLNHTENGIKDLSGKVANLSRELNTVEVEGLNPRGEWDNTTTYAVKDLVQYNGVSYVCHVANTGHTPTDTSYWQIVGYPIQIVDNLNSTSSDKALSANMGRVLNNNLSAIGESVVNCWDERWEVGAISSSTGENYSLANSVRSIGYCPIKPSTDYYVSGTGIDVFFYDANRNFIGNVYRTNATFTTPSNARYFRIDCRSTATYNNNISINYPSSFTSYYPARLSKVESGWATLLWTNASPSASFARQDISIDTTPYSYIIVNFRVHTSYEANAASAIASSLHKSGEIISVDSNQDVLAVRFITISSTSVGFSGCVRYNLTSTGAGSNNAFNIPLTIWGIK